MKRLHIIILGLLIAAQAVYAEELSRERQQEIIENYMRFTGQVPSSPVALSDDDAMVDGPVKCGTPAILEFRQNYDRLDRDLLMALGVQAYQRPQLEHEYDTPGGHIKLHYSKNGDNAVYRAGADSDHDGVPDYVEVVALAADSCYDFIFNQLGYPVPLTDIACVDGGDERTDIYLDTTYIGSYGLTYPEDECVSGPVDWRMPAWIKIHHNFQHLPEYVDRPLDAARVTLAHELFHTSHFAMDVSEDLVWLEMTAVWMEEQMYDDINDYYLLDNLLFDYPTRSLQSTTDYHYYASMLFPLYLSERYGVDIIRDIWTATALYDDPQWLLSINENVKSVSSGTDSLATAFAEFAVWNLFTGPYAHQAPDGVGYSESEYYDYIPFEKMDRHQSYRFFTLNVDSLYRPEVNAATYVRLDDLDRLDTISWECQGGSFDNLCWDSTAFADTLLHFDFMIPVASEDKLWGISTVLQSRSDPDSHLVWTTTRLGSDFKYQSLNSIFGDSIDFRQYRSVTVILSNTSTIQTDYDLRNLIPFGYRSLNWSNITIADAIPGAVLSPYPNPAVVTSMSTANVTFRLQMPMADTGYAEYETAYLMVDIYTVEGERVRTIEGDYSDDDRIGNYRIGVYEVGWDMKNTSNNDVASGVYLAYARLWDSLKKRELLAEDRVKVAIIR